MYLEAVFCFYILLNHLVGYSLFWLITFCSLFNIIKRNFALTLAKLYFYIDYAVRFFVGKKYNRLHMERYVLIDVSFLEPIQTNMKCSKISPFVCRNISTNSVAKKY